MSDLEREVRAALETALRPLIASPDSEAIADRLTPVVVRLIEEHRAPLIADYEEMTREARLSRESTEKAVIRQRKAEGTLVEVRANLAEEVEFHGHMARERDLAFEEADQHRIAHKMAWERAEKAEAARDQYQRRLRESGLRAVALKVRAAKAEAAARTFSDVVTSYMLGDVDGAVVSRAQHALRDALRGES